jgi:hypothetical protein
MAAHRYDFSFSGLKTAVARWVEQADASGQQVAVADVAASFREAVVDVLVTKALDACASTACRGCCSAAASSPTAVCARRGARGRSGCRRAHSAAEPVHRQRSHDRRARVGADREWTLALEPRVRRGLDVAGDRDPGRRGGHG